MEKAREKQDNTCAKENRTAGYIILAYDNNTTMQEDIIAAAKAVLKVSEETAFQQMHMIERNGAGQIGPVYEEELDAVFHCDGFVHMVAGSGRPVEAEVIFEG